MVPEWLTLRALRHHLCHLQWTLQYHMCHLQQALQHHLHRRPTSLWAMSADAKDSDTHPMHRRPTGATTKLMNLLAAEIHLESSFLVLRSQLDSRSAIHLSYKIHRGADEMG